MDDQAASGSVPQASKHPPIDEQYQPSHTTPVTGHEHLPYDHEGEASTYPDTTLNHDYGSKHRGDSKNDPGEIESQLSELRLHNDQTSSYPEVSASEQQYRYGPMTGKEIASGPSQTRLASSPKTSKKGSHKSIDAGGGPSHHLSQPEDWLPEVGDGGYDNFPQEQEFQDMTAPDRADFSYEGDGGDANISYYHWRGLTSGTAAQSAGTKSVSHMLLRSC